jgi:glycosyltransferase involved in cell wall biosynthesis
LARFARRCGAGAGAPELTIPDIPGMADYPCRPVTGEEPLLTLVTTVRNGEKTLGRTLDSVRAQGFPALEYIVADAGSTDGTLDLIRANADIVTYWQSERDRGISDGFNKGIALARGKYVLLLNADDWLSPEQLANGVETLERTGADFVFGDLIYHGADGQALHRIRGDADYAGIIFSRMPALNHPTVIVRRSAYERFGLFDLTLRLAMDYELLLRLHSKGCRGVYDARMTGHMSLAGASDRFSVHSLAEVRDITIHYGMAPLAAWSRFIFRIVKGHSRRMLERLLPPSLYHLARRSVNRDYSGKPT